MTNLRAMIAAFGAATMLAAAPAAASTFDGAIRLSFGNISNNGAPDAAGQLLAEVVDGLDDHVGSALFRFSVTSDTPNPDAVITAIYFDDVPGISFPRRASLLERLAIQFSRRTAFLSARQGQSRKAPLVLPRRPSARQPSNYPSTLMRHRRKRAYHSGIFSL